MLARTLTGSLGNFPRKAKGECLRRNRLDFRIVVQALGLAAVLLSAASCGGGSAKSSTATKHAVPRELYIINAKTGAVDQNFPDLEVSTVVSDGSGGWYIGGCLSCVSGVNRDGLARLRNDGSLDPEFAYRLPKGTVVMSIVHHENVVYAGEGKANSSIKIVAAFDATSGRKLWQVRANAPDYVFSGGGLAFADGKLFVGGNFSRVAGVPRSGLAALDPGTGKPTSWHVHLASERETKGQVNAMSVENGAIYYSGFFKGTETYRENKGLGAISIRTGRPTSWNPEPTNDLDEATAILATHGQVLAGGNGFAVFDARSGRVVPWYKHLTRNANAFAASGNTVYLGASPNDGSGILTRAGGKRVHNLAAVVLPSGRVTNWRPMPSPIPYVRALAVSGQNVLVAG